MITRTITPYIERAAEKYPVVAITGPRQSGKTTFCRNFFTGYTYVNLEELAPRGLAATDPRGFFKSYPPPVIIDEIQQCPELVSQIIVEADERQKCGEFVIVGSLQTAQFAAVAQSLAGRAAMFTMLPFSLSELKGYGKEMSRSELILSGGMPRLYEHDIEPAEYYRNYITTCLERDLRNVINVKNFGRFETFLGLMAGRIAQLVNFTALACEVGVSSTTLRQWADMLEAAHVIFSLKPWQVSIGKTLSKTPRYYFTDTGVACSLLGISEAKHLDFHPMRGALFDNLVIAEMVKRKNNNNLSAELYFYRTLKGSNVDLLEVDGNILTPWEIKMSDTPLPQYFRHIRSFRKDATNQGFICGDGARTGGLIYSGENIEQLDGWQCVNFMDIS